MSSALAAEQVSDRRRTRTRSSPFCATGRLAGPPGVVSDRSADLLCRDGGSRRCACCRPDPRRPASAPGSRSRGRAAALVKADLAPESDDSRKRCRRLSNSHGNAGVAELSPSMPSPATSPRLLRPGASTIRRGYSVATRRAGQPRCAKRRGRPPSLPSRIVGRERGAGVGDAAR